ncbi:dihydrodipicolinate synthase family protein [Alienimonas californiensis]|uniref:4-hydroxy-tetrahydrodipicolinate synthase n=1 Tax=Alienimonas californiensis TaxID=2527989 RepID=A0A517PF12_9PLAN|nr:dihydrodipicolinate synthase family protein [Alienimonas californiensis]QDT17952.1 4-hydroxy-tetrahydrodipicolinate synthase [Alienimonas californiensis]
MFRGILVPTLTPRSADGGVDEAALRSHANWLIGKGVHGLYANGSTGEGLRLTAEERRLVTRATCEAAAGRVPVLTGVGGANLKETLAECEHAAECGAAAVAVTAPIYFRPSPEAIEEHFRRLAAESPVGVLVYNIPSFAVTIPVELTARLAKECPNVVGVKDSSGDVSAMVRLCSQILPERPDFAILTGWDAALLPMLAAGAHGGTNATANAAPELVVEVYDRVVAGDLEGARAAQWRLTTLFDAQIGVGEFPDGFRLAAEARGALPPGEPRLPQPTAALGKQGDHRRTLKGALVAAGMDA